MLVLPGEHLDWGGGVENSSVWYIRVIKDITEGFETMEWAYKVRPNEDGLKSFKDRWPQSGSDDLIELASHPPPVTLRLNFNDVSCGIRQEKTLAWMI